MKFVMQSPHLTLGDKLQKTIEKKFEGLDKLFDRIDSCNILLKKEKDDKRENCIVEARLSVPGNDLFAREQAESFEIAAEKVSGDLESQLRKHKAKLNKKSRIPGDQALNDEEPE